MTGASLFIEQTHLAHAGVHQQAKRERQISVLGKVTDCLRTPVFFQQEIVFSQVMDDLPMLVTHRGQHVDDFHLYGKRRRLLAVHGHAK